MKKLRTTLMAALSIFAVMAFVSCGDKNNGGDGKDPDPDPDPDPTAVKYTNFTPLQGQAGTKFYIVGEGFGTDVSKVKAWLDDTELTVESITNDVRLNITLPQIVGNTYKVKVKIGDEDVYTYDGLFTYLLTFSEVSTFAGVQGSAGAVDGAAASATFNKPMILAYDKKEDALFVHEDHEDGGKKLRRIKGGQVETLFNYTTSTPTVNNIRAIAMSVTCDTLFFANDRAGNTNRGVVYISKRGDDFKTMTCLIGPSGSTPEVESDGQHFNHLATHPVTGKLHMWDWRGYVYAWDKKAETAEKVYDFRDKGLLSNGNYSTISFSKDGTKIYMIARNGVSAVFVADYNVATDQISGDFKLFAGSTSEAGNVDGLGAIARFNEPFHYMFGADGYLYGGDLRNWSLRKISPEGEVTTMAGVGTWSSVNGALNIAGFDAPASIAFDNNSNMYIADFFNHLVRKVTVVTQ